MKYMGPRYIRLLHATVAQMEAQFRMGNLALPGKMTLAAERNKLRQYQKQQMLQQHPMGFSPMMGGPMLLPHQMQYYQQYAVPPPYYIDPRNPSSSSMMYDQQQRQHWQQQQQQMPQWCVPLTISSNME